MVSIVVIGRNEEEHLDAAFRSIQAIRFPREMIDLIYVDSESSDQSVAIAGKYSDRIVVERSFYPTAARGRNRGLLEARGSVVHFMDGDMEIDPDYLKRAVEILNKKTIHAVTGIVVEKKSGESFLNGLISSAWDYPPEGFTESTKAGGTYRRAALLQINGYDERIRFGEETELGIRFRDAGFRIYQINQIMGIHDYAIGSIGGYIQRYISDGESKSVQFLQKDRSAHYLNTKRSAVKNIAFNLFLVLFYVCLVATNAYLLIPALAAYLVFLLLKYTPRKMNGNNRRRIYFVLMNLLKPFTFYGQITVLVRFILSGDYRRSIVAPKMILIGAKK